MKRWRNWQFGTIRQTLVYRKPEYRGSDPNLGGEGGMGRVDIMQMMGSNPTASQPSNFGQVLSVSEPQFSLLWNGANNDPHRVVAVSIEIIIQHPQPSLVHAAVSASHWAKPWRKMVSGRAWERVFRENTHSALQRPAHSWVCGVGVGAGGGKRWSCTRVVVCVASLQEPCDLHSLLGF